MRALHYIQLIVLLAFVREHDICGNGIRLCRLESLIRHWRKRRIHFSGIENERPQYVAVVLVFWQHILISGAYFLVAKIMAGGAPAGIDLFTRQRLCAKPEACEQAGVISIVLRGKHGCFFLRRVAERKLIFHDCDTEHEYKQKECIGRRARSEVLKQRIEKVADEAKATN